MSAAPLGANQLAASGQAGVGSYSHDTAGMTQQSIAMQEIQNYSHLAHQSLALAAAQQSQPPQQPPPPFSQAVSPYGQASPQLAQGPPQGKTFYLHNYILKIYFTKQFILNLIILLWYFV